MKITKKFTEDDLETLRKHMEKQIFSAFISLNRSRQKPSPEQEVKKNRKKSEILPYIPLFSVLSEKKLHFIAKKFKLRKYKKGDMLFNYGDEANDVYIVKSGEILIYKDLDSENIIQYAICFAGDIFGEMGVISGSPRSLSARVYSDAAELYVISREDFNYILKKYPELAINLSKIFCQRIEETNRRLLDNKS